MNVHHKPVCGSFPHHIVQPSGPSVGGILHESGFYAHDAPLLQQGEKLIHLFLQSVLVDVEPYTDTLLLAILNDAVEVKFINNLCCIAVMTGAGHIPLPVVEHVRDIVFGTEVNGLYSELSVDAWGTHYLTRFYEIGIVDFARRVQI